MTTTQKQEAMQAVRLLYKWAVKAAVNEPEALYQARQMLEGFIDGAGMLESTDNPLAIPVFYSDAFWRGARYSIEGLVFVEVYGKRLRGRIDAFKPTGFTSVTVEGLGLTEFDWTDIVQWNPDGSQ